ncbi:MAG TPA: hypothetical protein VLC09_10360 [Polyangiaceae bacterium]|nr:hypothetical protein [Polyangiaceae bacterium]
MRAMVHSSHGSESACDGFFGASVGCADFFAAVGVGDVAGVGDASRDGEAVEGEAGDGETGVAADGVVVGEAERATAGLSAVEAEVEAGAGEGAEGAGTPDTRAAAATGVLATAGIAEVVGCAGMGSGELPLHSTHSETTAPSASAPPTHQTSRPLDGVVSTGGSVESCCSFTFRRERLGEVGYIRPSPLARRSTSTLIVWLMSGTSGGGVRGRTYARAASRPPDNRLAPPPGTVSKLERSPFASTASGASGVSASRAPCAS